MATAAPATHRNLVGHVGQANQASQAGLGHIRRTSHSGRPRHRRRPETPAPPPVWFAERLLGILVGVRAITCLAGHVHPDTYDRLWDLANARADWRNRARGHRPALHSCRGVRVADNTLEVSAVVTLTADCYRAIAFRLERPADAPRPRHAAQGWRLTAVAAR